MKQFVSMIAVCLIIIVLFVLYYVITSPPKNISLKDIPPTIAVHTNSRDSVSLGPILTDSLKTDGEGLARVDCYIIVESFKNLTLARERAGKLTDDFNANFIVLPPTTEGYYRISFGKYATYEEAESAIKSIRTKIRPDAWIYSVKQ
jgi:hypothetical protein